MSDVAVVLAASLPPTIVGFFGLLQARRNNALSKQVHEEVKTQNGITLAVLADRTEGRRILEDIAPADRTESEKGYVDKLEEGGRNMGHNEELPPG